MEGHNAYYNVHAEWQQERSSSHRYPRSNTSTKFAQYGKPTDIVSLDMYILWDTLSDYFLTLFRPQRISLPSGSVGGGLPIEI
jgi:hypothetical protein